MLTSIHTPLQLNRRKLLTGCLSLGCAGLTPLTVNAQPKPQHGIVGRTAPALKADFWIDAQGKSTQFDVTAQLGKWVHLKFWQSWCPGCHARGFPTLVKMAKAFENEPRVINVALQTVFEGAYINRASKVRETQLRYQLPIVFGHDSNAMSDQQNGTMHRYRTGGTPWHVVIAPTGKVVFNDFGLNADSAIDYIKKQLG